MRQALELPVAGEEVLLDVAHHALVLALGARAPWPAGPRLKAIMGGHLQKTRIVFHRGADPMADDLGLLVIDQDLSGHSAKIFETLNQAFIGMFGVLARHRHKMEAARVAQGVDREMHLLLAARHQRAVFGPIVLQLFARGGLEAHRRPRLAQWPLGPDVIAQDTSIYQKEGTRLTTLTASRFGGAIVW